jgi:S-adenosylmethionine-dependent methyltransferase
MIEDARARLSDRFGDRVTFHVGNAEDTLPDWMTGFDLVLMHHVIEYLPKPVTILRQLAERVKRGGELSLITLNPVSEVLRRIHFDASPQLAYERLTSCCYDAQWFGDARLYTDDELAAMLSDAGWHTFDQRGMRIFFDYTDETLSDDENYRQAMLKLEMTVSGERPYRDISRYRQWACELQPRKSA